jgi:hypothetical protein
MNAYSGILLCTPAACARTHSASKRDKAFFFSEEVKVLYRG